MGDRKPPEDQVARRSVLGGLAASLAAGVAFTAGALAPKAARAATAPAEVPSIPGYDWSKHAWAFGVDATKCIGCLRCVEACKKEKALVFGDLEDPNSEVSQLLRSHPSIQRKPHLGTRPQVYYIL